MSARLYGCHNRPPFVATQTIGRELVLRGLNLVSQPVQIPNFSAADSACHFTRSDLGRADAGCLGCRWRAP